MYTKVPCSLVGRSQLSIPLFVFSMVVLLVFPVLSNEQEEGLGAFLGLVGNELTLQLLDGRENLNGFQDGFKRTKAWQMYHGTFEEFVFGTLALRVPDQLIEKREIKWMIQDQDVKETTELGYTGTFWIKLIVQEVTKVRKVPIPDSLWTYTCCPRTVGKKSKRFSKCHLYFICLVSRWSPCWVYLKHLASE